MEFWKFLIIVAMVNLFSCTSEKTKEKTVGQDNLANQLDEYFTALAHLKKFNGGILINRDGQTIINKAFNISDDSSHHFHVTENSQFDIHSISKLMAKACIIELEKENLLDRTDQLIKYIPGFPRGDEITIQLLLDNNAGLPRELSNEPKNLIDKSPEELVELIKKETLIATPGAEPLYSNLGYQLVYYIIAKVTDKPFVKYMNDQFFEPLGMDGSGAHFHLEKDNITKMVNNHTMDDDQLIQVPNIGKDGKNQAKIYSTLDDLMNFIEHVKEEPYRSKLTNKRGNIGWSGGGEGILTHAKAALESNYEFILFSNFDDIPFGDILEDVEKIMTHQPYDLPKEINRKTVKLDRVVMERYIGKYDMPEFNYDEFEFRIEQDSLVFYQNGERNTALKAENDTTFFDDPKSEEYFVFKDAADGNYQLIFFWNGVGMKGVKKNKE